MKEKKIMQIPEMELIRYEATDVITTSPVQNSMDAVGGETTSGYGGMIGGIGNLGGLGGNANGGKTIKPNQ